jgi:hypothetical protein
MLALGCATQPDDSVAADLDTTFELRVGQSAIIAAEDLAIGFEGVSSDSRCGKGDTCIWEGDAVVEISLQLAGTGKTNHPLHTNGRFANSVLFQGFSVRLVALLPQPVSGQDPAAADYVAMIQVTRGLSGHENIL